MECPHCLIQINEDWRSLVGTDRTSLFRTGPDGNRLTFHHMRCPNPECDKFLAKAMERDREGGSEIASWFAYPRNPPARSVPPELPSEIAEDYREAGNTIHMSAQASAAISRRIIQRVLKDKGEYTQRNLSDQIEACVADNTVPTHISGNLDYLREIGNFAAHTQKSEHSGEVIRVEPGEAEWALEVLDSLFDFYYVQPARDEVRRESFNAKLRDAGRNEIASDDAGQ